MNTIIDFYKMPERRLRVRQEFCAMQHQSLGEIICRLKQQSASFLTTKILEKEDFFKVELNKDMFGTVSGDCIVMTETEFADIMRKQFRKGVDHAQGFMPYDRY